MNMEGQMADSLRTLLGEWSLFVNSSGGQNSLKGAMHHPERAKPAMAAAFSAGWHAALAAQEADDKERRSWRTNAVE